MAAVVLDTKIQNAKLNNGLLSPVEEGANTSQNGQQNPPPPPPPLDSDDEDETGKTQPTEEQNQAVQRVLQCKKDDYRNILGVQDKYDTPEAEREEILMAFRKLGTLIHADHIKGKKTRKAYYRVLSAANKLGVEQDDINEVKTWDGEEDLTESMELDEKEIPWPTELVKKIYQEATKELGQLSTDPNDSEAIRALDALNKRIREQNEKDGNKLDQWTIDYKMYAEHFKAVKPYVDHLWNTPEGQPMDPEAISKVNSLNDQLKKLNLKYHFPETWVMQFPTAEQLAEHQAKNKTEKEAKENEERARLERERLERERLEREKLERETKFGNIKFPWVTYPLPTGERIITGRQRSGDDIAGSICCVELPGGDPNDPDFRFRKDVDILELQKYFATPGIKRMGETDEEGRPVKVWRKKDRKGFKKFLFCVVGEIEMSSKAKPDAAEGLCCWEMDDGIKFGTRSGFIGMLGQKTADGYIGRYCERKGITAPWDVKPKSAKIPYEQKEMLEKLQANIMAANLGAGNLASGWTAVNSPPGNSTSGWTAVNSPPGNSTAGNSALKSLEDKLAAMERKIEGLQSPSTGGNSALKSLEDKLTAMEKKIEGLQSPNTGSLDSILKKLEQMETKMAEVDKISSSTERLSNVVTLLVEKVGLNNGST